MSTQSPYDLVFVLLVCLFVRLFIFPLFSKALTYSIIIQNSYEPNSWERIAIHIHFKVNFKIFWLFTLTVIDNVHSKGIVIRIWINCSSFPSNSCPSNWCVVNVCNCLPCLFGTTLLLNKLLNNYDKKLQQYKNTKVDPQGIRYIHSTSWHKH